ncbi:hypothetical protein LXL04_021366 [Taraxacum kok-saghyz]
MSFSGKRRRNSAVYSSMAALLIIFLVLHIWALNSSCCTVIAIRTTLSLPQAPPPSPPSSQSSSAQNSDEKKRRSELYRSYELKKTDGNGEDNFKFGLICENILGNRMQRAVQMRTIIGGGNGGTNLCHLFQFAVDQFSDAGALLSAQHM